MLLENNGTTRPDGGVATADVGGSKWSTWQAAHLHSKGGTPVKRNTGATPYTPASSGGGGESYTPASTASSGPSASDLLAQMMREYQERQRQAAQAAMDAANKQIDLSLSNALANYGNQRKSAMADYQTAINNSELNRFWAGKNLRETQANRGLLDSGAGRQDRLFMDSNYNNNLTKILTERAKAYADIDNAVNTAKQNAEIAKANNYSNYLASNASAMSSLLPALLTGYDGDVSTLTSALAAFNEVPTAAVQNQASQVTPTVANILAAYDDNSGYKKKNTNYVY